MFIPNYDKTEIINVRHIIKIYISEPAFEQKDYCVICNIMLGSTAILYRGEKSDCEQFIANIYRQY